MPGSRIAAVVRSELWISPKAVRVAKLIVTPMMKIVLNVERMVAPGLS